VTALARGRGWADRVVIAAEDWQDTCLGRGGHTCGAILTTIW
jgi:hypothetical protein